MSKNIKSALILIVVARMDTLTLRDQLRQAENTYWTAHSVVIQHHKKKGLQDQF